MWARKRKGGVISTMLCPEVGNGPFDNPTHQQTFLSMVPVSLQEMIDLARQMPKAPTPGVSDRLNPEKCPCVCGKYVPVSSCSVAWSGFINYVVSLCPSCEKDLADCARVVCPRCKVIVLLIKPYKDRHGFEFKKGGVYHVQSCPVCVPGVSHSAIAEKIMFYKQRGILYCEDTSLIS